LRPFGVLGSRFGKAQPFRERLGARFDLVGVLLDSAKDIGRLMHQIESCGCVVWYRKHAMARDILAHSS
jgi:hypothetical protein